MALIEEAFEKLRVYCEKEDFKGWDPYDGLNSKLFQCIPGLKKIPFVRLLWIQFFKRSPINLRNIMFVPKQQYNSKGIALFLQAYCNIYKVYRNNDIEQKTILNTIHYLANLLISLKTNGYSGACWGYNFDWESKAFFLPRFTPTVVASSFAVESLLSAYEITKNELYLSTALSCADFILQDLNRIEKPKGFMFSYSPLDRRAVYNATLLGSKSLALLYAYTQNISYKDAAFLSANAVCDEQNDDGSFPHSDQVGNSWRDNFHTGFKLESLYLYEKYCGDNSFMVNRERGYSYWIDNFFDKENGIAKYYDQGKKNVIDLHCTAQAIPTLYKLKKLKEQEQLSEKILQWAIVNMQNRKDGYFYFQINNKIAYMRWPNAWMLYGMSYWLLYESMK